MVPLSHCCDMLILQNEQSSLTMLNCVSLLASARLSHNLTRSFLLCPAINVTLPHMITVIWGKQQQQQNVMIRTRFNFLELAGTLCLALNYLSNVSGSRFGTSQDLW